MSPRVNGSHGMARPSRALRLLFPILALLSTLAAPGWSQTTGSLGCLGRIKSPVSYAVKPWQGLTLVGTDQGLRIQDLRDPTAMVTLSALGLGRPVVAIEAFGDSAIVGLDNGVRCLVDLGTPAAPILVRLPAGYAFPNLWVEGEPFIVEGLGDKVSVYRWTGTERLLVGSVTVGAFSRLRVSGQAAYAMSDSTVRIVALDDPARPAAAGVVRAYTYPSPNYFGYPVPEQFLDVQVVDQVLHLLVQQTLLMLRTVDARDPARPVSLSLVSVGFNSSYRWLDVAGGRAVVAGLFYGSPQAFMLRAFTVADPAAVRPLGDYQGPAGIYLRGIALADRQILCATTQALQLLEVTGTPGDLVHDWGYSWHYLSGVAIAASEQAAYVVGTVPSLAVAAIDASAPLAMSVASVLPLYQPLLAPSYAECVGEAVYLVTPGYGLGLIDLADPLHPASAGLWQPDGQQFTTLQVSGDQMALGKHDGAAFYDISEPLTPRLLGMRPAELGASWAIWEGDLAVAAITSPHIEDFGVSDGRDTLLTLDMTDPGSPREIGRLAWSADLNRGFRRGNLVYAQDGAYGVMGESVYTAAFSLVGADAPTQVLDWRLAPVWAWGSSLVAGPPREILGYHCLANPDNVSIYELRNVTADPPLIAQCADLASWAGSVKAYAVAGDRVYLLSQGQVSILHFLPPSGRERVRNAFQGLAPNPFNGGTEVAFSLERQQRIELQVYDLRGRLRRTLLQEELGPGDHKAVWDGCEDGGRPAASGLYIFRLRTEEGEDTVRGLLVK